MTWRWLTVAAALAVLATAGCGSSAEPEPSPGERGNVAALPADDPGVAAARATAQRRWREFVTSFRRRPERSHDVKVALPTTDGSREHLWIAVTGIRDNVVAGTIANDPVYDIGHVYGDPVTVKRVLVEDWLISKGGRLIAGGFSTAAPEGQEQPLGLAAPRPPRDDEDVVGVQHLAAAQLGEQRVRREKHLVDLVLGAVA